MGESWVAIEARTGKKMSSAARRAVSSYRQKKPKRKSWVQLEIEQGAKLSRRQKAAYDRGLEVEITKPVKKAVTETAKAKVVTGDLRLSDQSVTQPIIPTQQVNRKATPLNVYIPQLPPGARLGVTKPSETRARSTTSSKPRTAGKKRRKRTTPVNIFGF